MSEQFVKDAEEAEHELLKFKTAGASLGHQLASGLLPVVTSLAEGAIKVVQAFREWTKGTHLVRNLVIALTAAATAAAVVWGLLNLEVLAVVVALALLGIAIDDIITYFEGGDSVLGRFLDRVYGLGASKDIAKELKDAWEKVSDAFGKLWDAVKDVGPALSDLFDTFTGKKNDVTQAKSGIQAMADVVKELADELTRAVKWFDSMLTKFDEFAKAHPTLVHAFQRQAHEIAAGDPTIFGVLGNLGRTAKEAVTGDASDVEGFNAQKPSGIFQVPNAAVPGTIQLTQHNQTVIDLGNVGAANDILKMTGAVKTAVKDGQQDANNAAFATVTGGG